MLEEDIPYLEEDDEDELDAIFSDDGGNGKLEDEDDLEERKGFAADAVDSFEAYLRLVEQEGVEIEGGGPSRDRRGRPA